MIIVSEPLALVTCYDYAFAKALDGVPDYFLVGDSVGMVVYGDLDTKHVSLETMLLHTQAVCRGAKITPVIADMPIHSYDSVEEAEQNAKKFKDVGAYAVKMEGATPATLKAVSKVWRTMPVMGHVGLTPQWLEKYEVQGRDPQAAESILKDARALEKAGCDWIVLECIPTGLAKKITESLEIPTIGIGAGPHCSGQVLVLPDLLGLYTDLDAKFVKRFADLKGQSRSAVESFVRDVRKKKFPEEKHGFR